MPYIYTSGRGVYSLNMNNGVAPSSAPVPTSGAVPTPTVVTSSHAATTSMPPIGSFAHNSSKPWKLYTPDMPSSSSSSSCPPAAPPAATTAAAAPVAAAAPSPTVPSWRAFYDANAHRTSSQPPTTTMNSPAPQAPQAPPAPQAPAPQGPPQTPATHGHPPPPPPPQAPPARSGFASPRRTAVHDTPKYHDDKARIKHAVQQAVPEAVREVVRENWEKVLLGSEFHQAFLLNASVHHASSPILRRSLRDFGSRMVSDAKSEVMAHFQTTDLDQVADMIISKASDSFLDRALEKRLQTIDGRRLINALCRAERLGYEKSDIVEDEGARITSTAPPPAHDPRVPSQPPPQPIPPQHPNYPAQQPSQQLPQASRPRPPPVARQVSYTLQCRLCWRKFQTPPPYEYHVQKMVCTKQAPDSNGFAFSCSLCGSGFVTKVGQQYHQANNVCGAHETAPATPLAGLGGDRVSPITLSSENTSPATRPPSATPIQAPMNFTASQATASPSSNSDAYAHLNPDTRARLEEELRQAELTYRPRFEEAERIPDPAERKTRLESLQNSFSTKQSMVRKKYGVRLRQRRTKAEIDGERMRVGLMKQPAHSPPSDTPSAKRQRMSETPSSQPIPPSSLGYPTIPSPSQRIPVAEMNSGLHSSKATAATVDPTASLLAPPPAQPILGSQSDLAAARDQTPPPSSLGSLQRKGYRVSSHIGGQPKIVSPASAGSESDSSSSEQSDQPDASTSLQLAISADNQDDSKTKDQSSGSESESESESDSDSDEEIPATLPGGPKRPPPPGTPQMMVPG